MNKIFTLSLCLTFFFTVSVRAGDELCNGGDVILCPHRTPLVLDILERNVLHGYDQHPQEDFIRITRSADLRDDLEQILQPLQHKTPDVYRCLSSYVSSNSFWDELLFVRDHDFYEVEDEISFIIPRGCEKKQAAIQFRNPVVAGPHRYMIQQDLWQKMDDFQRSSLIIHEIVLRNYILNSSWSKDTLKVRSLTAFLLSNETSRLSSAGLYAKFKELDFKCTPYGH